MTSIHRAGRAIPQVSAKTFSNGIVLLENLQAVKDLALLSGGAKQAVHYTDLTPAIVFMAVTKHGNNPFYRMLTSQGKMTKFHEGAFTELMAAYEDQFLSEIYIGWAQGFLDEERTKLEQAIKPFGTKISLGHPSVQIGKFAEVLRASENSAWYA